MRKLVIAVTFFCVFMFCVPVESTAQQPTATISALSGTVLVNGQVQEKGSVLSTGDIIDTLAGASIVLELSDGSQLEIGEKTRVDIAELLQTATGARTSRIKLAWGWIRVRLSPGHQKEGSAFDVETPNALVGVKFSEPWFEVSYDLKTGVTTIKAFTITIEVVDPVTGKIIGIVNPGQQATVDKDGKIMITSLPGAGESLKIWSLFRAINRGAVNPFVPFTPGGTLGRTPDDSQGDLEIGFTPGTRPEVRSNRHFRIEISIEEE